MKYLRYLLNENDKWAGTYGEPHKIEKVKFGGVLSIKELIYIFQEMIDEVNVPLTLGRFYTFCGDRPPKIEDVQYFQLDMGVDNFGFSRNTAVSMIQMRDVTILDRIFLVEIKDFFLNDSPILKRVLNKLKGYTEVSSVNVEIDEFERYVLIIRYRKPTATL